MLHMIMKFGFIALIFSTIFASCEKEQIIVPNEGYSWPNSERAYWPTEGWIDEPMEMHDMDLSKMEIANQFAKDDPLMRSLLVIKDGYLVFENYYGDGGVDESTNLWSVTKSVTSALVGMAWDDGYIPSIHQPMKELMPQYPEFKDITLFHTLTMTTGLSWNEEGPLWVKWILSDDLVKEALDRGFERKPGKQFFYSSGNSHFLTSLIYYRTGTTPGKLAKDRLFVPLGIPFDTMSSDILYTSWDQYIPQVPQTWRKDNKGIECAGFGLYLTARDMAKFGFLYLNQGRWEDEQIISKEWVRASTKDQITDIYGRYSYGYQWYLTLVAGHPAFLASGYGGQIIGIVPDLDMVVVLKYEAENAVHPVPGTAHDDMHLFELVVNAAT
jgi:CubicO group peptidase (beta-lactamase class C family)